MSQDLIVFGEDWGRHPSSTQHLFRNLSDDHRYLWINSIGLRQPKLNVRDAARVVEKVKQIGRAKTPHTPDATLPPNLSPPVWPMATSSVGKLFNRKVTAGAIQKRAKAMGLERPILWTSLPSAVDLVGCLEERAVVYYCGDDFGALAGVDHDIALQKEEALAKHADVILAASPALANKFPEHKTEVLPHGVDWELFTTPARRSPYLPRGRRVAGFYGSLSDWLDQEMVITAARSRPDWDFVLLGPQHVDVSSLKAEPNIRVLDPIPHDKLSSFCQHWDASLLPFKDNAQIRACNPLKLREYLAAGRPVISTAFPAMEEYRDVMNVVSSGDELARTLELLPEHHNAGPQRAAVASESWRHRSEWLEALFSQL